VRWAWLNIGFLRRELIGKTVEFGAGVFDLLLDLPTLPVIQFHYRARQSPVGAMGNRGDHLQIA
jgi:hypothetical protein